MNIKVNPPTLKFPTKQYSQGILVPSGDNNLLFVTGQLSQNKVGEIIHIGNIEMQTRVVFQNILKILEEVGMGYSDVVKLQIFVKNPLDIEVVSAIRDELFSESRPASTLVCVNGFAREGACVEVDVIAAKATD